MVWWNARGIGNKEETFKELLDEVGAVYGGVPESPTYKQTMTLSDKRWKWEAGPEGKPSIMGSTDVSGGVGCFTDTTAVESSHIRQNDFLVWHRLETGEGQAPLAVGTAYFPTAQDAEGHARANVALCGDLAYLTGQGYRVALGGDFNAHTGANGDKMPVDMAGRMLLETADWFGMVVVNTMPNKCIGGPTRVQVRVDGTQESTIDYVMCSSDLAPNVKSMVIDDR